MDVIVRAAIIYVFVWLVLRALGKRELGELTAFELVLLFIIGDLVQQSITQDDKSLTSAVLAISTIALLIVMESYAVYRWRRTRPVLEGTPVMLVYQGQVIDGPLQRQRMTIEDLQEAFAAYDTINSTVVNKIPVMQRLQAKLILKALLLLSLDGQGGTASDICASELIFDESDPEKAVSTVDELLRTFAEALPDDFRVVSEEGLRPRYSFKVSSKVPVHVGVIPRQIEKKEVPSLDARAMECNEINTTESERECALPNRESTFIIRDAQPLESENPGVIHRAHVMNVKLEIWGCTNCPQKPVTRGR